MYAEATKVCSGCGLERPISAFGKAATNRDGLNTRCKDCINRRDRLPENRDARREYHRNYQRARRTRPEIREQESNRNASYKYGISVSEVRELRSAPCCQCCGIEFKDDPNHRHIDHCHESGVVRGIVCRTCNLTIQGEYKECVSRLASCLKYLERHCTEPQQ